MYFYTTTSFTGDIQKGKVGEIIFTEDFLNFLNVSYENVTDSQKYRIIDSDFVSSVGLYEIKSNYQDDKKIIIEEYTNINESLSPVSFGWFYKSKADMLVFISKVTRSMILVPFTPEFKEHYKSIKENYQLIWNKITIKNNSKWQSAFRKIPLSALNGYYAFYKRILPED